MDSAPHFICTSTVFIAGFQSGPYQESYGNVAINGGKKLAFERKMMANSIVLIYPKTTITTYALGHIINETTCALCLHLYWSFTVK